MNAPGEPRNLLTILAPARVACGSELGPIGTHAIGQGELGLIAWIDVVDTKAALKIVERKGDF